MSSVTHYLTQSKFHKFTAQQHWCLAVVAPVALAPAWLNMPATALGPFSSLGGLLLVLMLLVSTITDLSHRKIYNCVTYTTFGWAIAFNVVSAWLPNSNAIGLSSSVAGGAICFLVMLVPYSMARGGAGDVKMAAAIGALVGMDEGLLIIAFTYILAAGVILVWTSFARGPTKLIAALFRAVAAKLFPQAIARPLENQQMLLGQPIPLAGFFSIATLLVLFDVSAMLWSWQ